METSHFKSQARELNLHLVRIPETVSLLSISICFNIYPYFSPHSCTSFPPVQFNLSCIPNILNISNEGSPLPVAISQILTVENAPPCPKLCDIHFINTQTSETPESYTVILSIGQHRPIFQSMLSLMSQQGKLSVFITTFCERGRRTECDFMVWAMSRANPIDKTPQCPPASSSQVKLCYIQQLSCVCHTALPVVTLQQLSDSTTYSGLLFLPMHTETAVSLPQGFLFFDTYLAQAVCQALAEAFSQFCCCCCFLALKPGRLKHTLSCKSCKSASKSTDVRT